MAWSFSVSWGSAFFLDNMTLLNDDYRGKWKAFLIAARFYRRMCVTIAAIPGLVVSRYDALEAAKNGSPAISKAAVFNSLLASRMSVWLKMA